MKCPICGQELSSPYSSPKLVLFTHLNAQHRDKESPRMFSVSCPCGKSFDGFLSFAKHLVANNDEHLILFSQGATFTVSERTRHDPALGAAHSG